MSSVVVCGFFPLSIVLRFIGDVDIGEGSDGYGVCGLKFLSCPSALGCAIAIVARILNGLDSSFRSFKIYRNTW